MALDAYLELKEPKLDGQKYLMLYGVLQTLFLQQDAVTNMAEALDIEAAIDPIIKHIREIRNDSIGHPTKREKKEKGIKTKTFNFITRVSMKKAGFTLMTTSAIEETQFRDVNVLQLIESQREILQDTLNDVTQKLKEEEVKHKEQFKENKLADIFPQTLGYYFEKIGEAIHNNDLSEFGAVHVNLVVEIIDRFKDALNERGILEAYDSINDGLILIEYPLSELRLFFNNSCESKLNDKDAYIFIFFIRRQIKNLTAIAEEIDEEYQSEP